MNTKTPILSIIIAVAAGLIVLLLRFFPFGLETVYINMVQWATTLAAVALVIGVINLVNVHLGKLSDGGRNLLYSGALVIALAVTFVATLVLGPLGRFGGITPTSWLFDYIVLPVEISLMAILTVSLIYSAARLLRRKLNRFSVIFLSSAILVLLGGSLLGTTEIGLLGQIIRAIKTWLVEIPGMAGARGLLLGIALGATATGIRVLIGQDRPYGGS